MVPIYVVRDGEMHFQGRYDLPVRGRCRSGREGRGRTGGMRSATAEADAFRFLIGRLALNIDTGTPPQPSPAETKRAARTEAGRTLDAAAAPPGGAS